MDGCARVVAEGLGFPNELVLTPDGRRLIVAETFMNRLSAFDVDSGVLGRLIRVVESGDILEEVKTDGLGVFACMLGGDHGRTLFASVVPAFDEAEASVNHQAEIWMTKSKIQGLGCHSAAALGGWVCQKTT